MRSNQGRKCCGNELCGDNEAGEEVGGAVIGWVAVHLRRGCQLGAEEERALERDVRMKRRGAGPSAGSAHRHSPVRLARSPCALNTRRMNGGNDSCGGAAIMPSQKQRLCSWPEAASCICREGEEFHAGVRSLPFPVLLGSAAAPVIPAFQLCPSPCLPLGLREAGTRSREAATCNAVLTAHSGAQAAWQTGTRAAPLAWEWSLPNDAAAT